MIDFPVAQPCVTCGGSNECLACKFGETARRDSARKERQRKFKKKLLQFRIGMGLPLTGRLPAPKTRVDIPCVGGTSRFRWKDFLARFQGSLSTARYAGERIVDLFILD